MSFKLMKSELFIYPISIGSKWMEVLYNEYLKAFYEVKNIPEKLEKIKNEIEKHCA